MAYDIAYVSPYPATACAGRCSLYQSCVQYMTSLATNAPFPSVGSESVYD